MKKVTFLLLWVSFLAMSVACKKQQQTEQQTELVPGGKVQAAGVLGLLPETFTPPTRTRGATVINVTTYGATGNDTSDDTDEIQNAIDALPANGGTIYIPAGTYYINGDFQDASNNLIPGNSLRLRSKMHLQLADNAKLKHITSSVPKSYIVYAYRVTDLEISGGTGSEFIGERSTHVGSGEWGHGIQLRGCDRVTIRDIKFRDFFGDGISVGQTLYEAGVPRYRGTDVVIDNIIATNCRRQGLSIGPSVDVQVWDSEFSYTNGTSPQCGIDVEPEAGYFAENVTIENCSLINNQAYGALLWKGALNVSIKHCKIANNGTGMTVDKAVDTYISLNEIHNNTNHGIVLKDSTDIATVVQNTFYLNKSAPDRVDASIVGTNAATAQYDLLIRPLATNVTVYTNHYH